MLRIFFSEFKYFIIERVECKNKKILKKFLLKIIKNGRNLLISKNENLESKWIIRINSNNSTTLWRLSIN